MKAHCINHETYTLGCPQCGVAHLKQWQESEPTTTAQNALSGFVELLPARYRNASLVNFEAYNETLRAAVSSINKWLNALGKTNPPGGIIFLGPEGTGKTHLAIAIGREMALMGLTPRYMTVADMIKTIRKEWGENQGEELAQSKLASYDLLILDEVGVQTGSDNEIKLICEVINARYNIMKQTILISNFNLAEVQRYISKRAVSRVRERGMDLVFDGVQDFRLGGAA